MDASTLDVSSKVEDMNLVKIEETKNEVMLGKHQMKDLSENKKQKLEACMLNMARAIK